MPNLVLIMTAINLGRYRKRLAIIIMMQSA